MPPTPEYWYEQGHRHLAAKELDAAEHCFRALLALDPDHVLAHGNLALLLEWRGQEHDAEWHYSQAIARDDRHPSLFANLGAMLARQQRFLAAEGAYLRALLLDPESAWVWSNLGALQASQRRDEEAEHSLRTALALAPDSARAHLNLSYVLLRQGRWLEAWPHYQARPWYEALSARLPYPRWQGESLHGRRLLLAEHAGLGDILHFVRYAPWLHEQGAAHVALLCPPSLIPLLSSAPGLDELIPQPHSQSHSHSAHYDYWCPLLSLPAFSATTPDTIPAPIPYVQADPARCAYWQAQLPSNKPRVGLVWKGNPQFENDRARSLPDLSCLAPLAALSADIHFVSLQKGAGEDDDAPPGLHLQRLGPQLHDFADSAALVNALDLVICIDSAVAHLCGALARPGWLLLPQRNTDWRWLEHSAHSPWYPSLTLIRQSQADDWAPTLAALVPRLQAWLATRNDEKTAP